MGKMSVKISTDLYAALRAVQARAAAEWLGGRGWSEAEIDAWLARWRAGGNRDGRSAAREW